MNKNKIKLYNKFENYIKRRKNKKEDDDEDDPFQIVIHDKEESDLLDEQERQMLYMIYSLLFGYNGIYNELILNNVTGNMITSRQFANLDYQKYEKAFFIIHFNTYYKNNLQNILFSCDINFTFEDNYAMWDSMDEDKYFFNTRRSINRKDDSDNGFHIDYYHDRRGCLFYLSYTGDNLDKFNFGFEYVPPDYFSEGRKDDTYDHEYIPIVINIIEDGYITFENILEKLYNFKFYYNYEDLITYFIPVFISDTDYYDPYYLVEPDLNNVNNSLFTVCNSPNSYINEVIDQSIDNDLRVVYPFKDGYTNLSIYKYLRTDNYLEGKN